MIRNLIDRKLLFSFTEYHVFSIQLYYLHNENTPRSSCKKIRTTFNILG